MIATNELYQIDRGYTVYPPSVLIVGDSLPEMRNLKRKLENKGCRVSWADTSPEGLATASHKYFELMVLVLERPELDGPAMCNRLRVQPALATVPVVMLTNDGCTEEVPRSLNKGPIYYLPKDTCGEAMLSQIIEQVHYLTDRYL